MAIALVYDPLFLEHEMGHHPENPGRLQAITRLLQEHGLWDILPHLQTRDATDEELLLIHTPAHIRAIQDIAARGGNWVDPDTFVGLRSFAVAKRAAGACVVAVEALVRGEIEAAVCLTRPPGHHATPGRAMGFCIFNNIAIAAAKALQLGLERIAIVDIDVHHGNGTQDAFYEDSRVLYYSFHQYPFYPGTGHWQETGQGDGLGTTVNVPLPAGCGDAVYAQAAELLLAPVLRRYHPQLILVSAGFDAHWADPLAGMELSVSGYGTLMRLINNIAAEVCGRRLLYILEGGYHLPALAWCIRVAVALLQGLEPPPDPVGASPRQREPDVSGLLANCRTVHQLSG